jgi:cytochrome P450
VRDGTSSQEQKGQKTLFQELLNGDLPSEEKSIKRLVDEGQTMIAAGQQTTAHHLKTVTYHVLANPDIHKKLRAELESAIPNSSSIPPLAELEKLSYLRAIILEGHRFSHGVVSRLQRISPDLPLQYHEWTIPAGTPVSMTSVIQHADPIKFPNPEKFDPDRWIKASERLEKYLVNFSKGTRQCLGINLANAEIYLTLATVFRRFRIELYETTARDAEIAHDYFIPHGHGDSKGVRIVFK